MRVRHVILDRDGVLNEEAPAHGFIRSVDEWRWLPGSLAALGVLARAGLQLSVVTNQSGVGRGVMTLAAVERVHAHLRAQAAAAGVEIGAILYCPHHPDAGCRCRKPAPGLVLDALAAARVAPSATLLVGDDLRDLEAARAAGVEAVLVRTGKGSRMEPQVHDVAAAVYDDLAAAAAAIVADAVPMTSGTT